MRPTKRIMGLVAFSTLGMLLGSCQQSHKSHQSHQTNAVQIPAHTTDSDHSSLLNISDSLGAQKLHFHGIDTLASQNQIFWLDLSKRTVAQLSRTELYKLTQTKHVHVLLSDKRSVSYSNHNGYIVTSGDIIVGKSQNIAKHLDHAQTQSITGTNHSNHDNVHNHDDDDALHIQASAPFGVKGGNWPNKRVPYIIEKEGFSSYELKAILRGIQNWNNQKGNPVKWVEDNNAKDVVVFEKGAEGVCGLSYVGRIGGKQALELACFDMNTIIHEMGHATAYGHEHQRCDRDNYVSIPEDYAHLSPKNCYEGMHSHTKYDYDSVMNYAPPYVNALSTTNIKGKYIGKPYNLGRVSKLSKGDLKGLRLIYLGHDKPVDDKPIDDKPVDDTPDNDKPDDDKPIHNDPNNKTYSGSLDSWKFIAFPSDGFKHQGGAITATLDAPNGYRLYLQKEQRGSWSAVARLSGNKFSYKATAGKYRWRLFANGTAGDYKLVVKY